ncbi:hypothetical protein [Aerosakkonema funiforme]|uniref:hypothetical protein n=1 Tax=Aerosakkonema funiforme TaxID=1246630 RepID=UPI0018EFE64C|nr:hypothetical protein [Aerosakkonema funiforme]
MSSSGVVGNGIASEFGDLTGLTRQEVNNFLHGFGAKVKISEGGYVEYKFPDNSKIIIRPDGEVVRIPAPRYDSDGKNINKGLRLGKDGSLLPTRDRFGNPIVNTHNTGERVSD